jgi:uncharacterized protein (TIGR03435 family)
MNRAGLIVKYYATVCGISLLFLPGAAFSQSQSARPAFEAFEVAAIKQAAPEPGRYIKMQSAHQFYAKGHTLKLLVGAAYNLSAQAISGGPSWIESERYDILASTPGTVRPTLDEQMAMLRALLADRFKLGFHREPKEFAIFSLTVAKGGSKLKDSAGPVDALPELTNTVYADHLTLPARNATMAQFAAMLNRAVLDRPVIENTGLTGRFDFDLEWTPDESQFGGQLPRMATGLDSARPDLTTALQQQLGLRLQATRGPIQTIVIDRVEHPSAN